jgi:hypothetical protein
MIKLKERPMHKSKSIWAGAAMVVASALSMWQPEIGAAVGVNDPGTLFSMGLATVFLRLGIAKGA